uniref:Uncharacterized protein n=1 Tax=Strix occidentalis caurina TaxID=311401 RepID=A0A8D0EKC4_STROC
NRRPPRASITGLRGAEGSASPARWEPSQPHPPPASECLSAPHCNSPPEPGAATSGRGWVGPVALTPHDELPLPADRGGVVAGDAGVVAVVLEGDAGDLQGAHELLALNGDSRAGEDYVAVLPPGDVDGRLHRAGPPRLEQDREPPTPAQSGPCAGKAPATPRHVPAKILPQHLSARRKALIRWMLFLKALDSEPAIIFLIT